VRCNVWIPFLLLSVGWVGHAPDPSTAPQDKTECSSPRQNSNFVRNVLDLFNMAGTQQTKNFQTLTQSERNHLYFRAW
jgi:hypothetical protein